MIRFTVYIVDDEVSIRKGVYFALKKYYRMKAFPRAENAIAELKKDPPDLILLDIGLPGMSGMEALRRIKAADPNILVIMVTAYEDIQTVISAMKLGAYDYVVKPIQMSSLRLTVKNALETVRMKKEIQALQERYLNENLPCFIGESDVVQEIMGFIEKVARSRDTPILIMGESGTGKELIAHTIHYKSPQYQGPFVPINCAAIPKELIESELFGYEKGAFSGAGASGKRGLVEAAEEGTLFLDEVSDLSLEAQAKLLRFLETGEYYRVGGTRRLEIHTRVVSATNKDVLGMIEKGLFREDLYYRLSVVKIQVPSLNERREDILPVASYFLERLGRKHGKRFTGISHDAGEFLKSYNWKGNVRELKNMIERGVLVGEGPQLRLSDLGLNDLHHHPPITHDTALPPLPECGIDLGALEAHYIREALRKTKGNAVEAAKLLGMSYYTFRYRMRKLGLTTGLRASSA